MTLQLGDVLDSLGGDLYGAPRDTELHRIASLEAAGPQDISFLSNPRYQRQLLGSKAACVIVAPSMQALALERGACIVAPDPYLYFAKLTQLWRRHHEGSVLAGIHPSAVVHPDAWVHPCATIGPLCVIEKFARIGAHTQLKSRVTVGERCEIGDRCLLHPGVVIGADGFGFAPSQGQWVKIEQLGIVRIGNDVEIGANTCIDRGALGDTEIAHGVKLDNLIQIGHNVKVGEHTAMAGCVGVAGSATIGSGCTIGGGAIVLGHLQMADRVHVSAATVVTRSLHKPGVYTGMFPIDDNARWEKNAATLKQLSSLRERVKALEQSLEKRKNESP